MTYENPRLYILQRRLEPVPKRLLPAILPIILADILLQPPDRERRLLLGQPRGRPGKVGQHEKGRKRNADGHDPFDEEQPLPGAEPARAVHVARDTRRDETRKGARDERARVKDRRAQAELFARVPAGEVVEAAREVGGLDEAEDEADHEEACVVAAGGCRGGDDAPDDHLAFSFR